MRHNWGMDGPDAEDHRARRTREVPAWFARLARYGWGFLGIVGAAAVIVLGLAWFRELTVPLVLAGFFAVIFAPVVDWLEARRVPRSLGAVLVILLIAVVVAASLAVVVVGVIDQSDELAVRFDEAKQEIQDLVDQSSLQNLIERFRDSTSDAGELTRDGLGAAVGSVLTSITGFVSGLVLGIVLLYYLLKDGRQLAGQAVATRTSRSHEQADRILRKAAASIRGYFQGKTALAAVQGVFIGVGVALLGVPLAPAIAIVNFIGAYIPYLGAFVGGAFAALMALSEGGLGLAVATLVIVLVANLVIENMLEPKFLGTSLDLHPIVVLLATVAGGLAMGMVGLVLAAPLVAIGIDVFQELESSGYFEAEAEDEAEDEA